MKRLLAGAAALLLAAPLGAQTRQDTLDARYISAKLDTLQTANGVGARRNMVTAAKSRVAGWLARVDAVRVDTVRVTVVRVDTVFVSGLPNQPPVAALSTSCDPTTYSCAANTSASTDDRGIASRTTTWGDGASSTAIAPTHKYGIPGTWVVRLIVRDSAGLADTASKTVTLAAPPDTVVAPPPPPVNVDTSAVAKIAGPFLSSAQQVALGPPFAEYDAQFARFDDLHWVPYSIGTDPTFAPEVTDYYDRAEAYFVRWRQTGDAKYKLRGDSLARDYRKRYVERAGYLVAWNNAMTSGMAIHYLVTGDTMSRKAVGALGDLFAWNPQIATTDNRVQAYIIKTILDAYLIKAPSVGVNGLPPAGDWGATLRTKLTAILATQAADGAWRKTDCGDGGPLTVHPFTTGLLLDQLTRYYDQFEQDPRILPAVKKALDYLWANDWIAASNAFKYVERVCPSEGGPNPAPILNGLMVNATAWIYKMTGDATYKTRATAMIAGSVNSGEAGVSNPKQFNQQATAFRSLYWLAR